MRPDGGEHEVAGGGDRLGDRVLVKPGEMFPADGDVVKGKSASDESALTGRRAGGEGPGEPVFSGTLNLWGAVEFECGGCPAESTLQKIIRLIQTAQKLRAPSERFTDKFGARLHVPVLGAAPRCFSSGGSASVGRPFDNTAGHTSAFYRAMTLLVVASPCALVLSIPSAILAAIAWGARHGMLFRGGAAIEKLAEVDLVALDKTGTLTTGELAVVGDESFPPGREAGGPGAGRAPRDEVAAPDRPGHRPRRARAAACARRRPASFGSLTGQGVRGGVATRRCCSAGGSCSRPGRWRRGRGACPRRRRNSPRCG